MNIDEIQQRWGQLAADIKPISPEAAARSLARRSTAQDRLWRRYRRMCLMSVALSAALFIMMMRMGSVALAISFSAYALVASAMDLYLWLRIKAIDIVAMPVAEVARRATQCRRVHLIFMAVLIPMAIALIAAMAAFFIDDEAALTGMAIGGIVGLAIGTATFLRIMREYRHLTVDDADACTSE